METIIENIIITNPNQISSLVEMFGLTVLNNVNNYDYKFQEYQTYIQNHLLSLITKNGKMPFVLSGSLFILGGKLMVFDDWFLHAVFEKCIGDKQCAASYILGYIAITDTKISEDFLNQLKSHYSIDSWNYGKIQMRQMILYKFFGLVLSNFELLFGHDISAGNDEDIWFRTLSKQCDELASALVDNQGYFQYLFSSEEVFRLFKERANELANDYFYPFFKVMASISGQEMHDCVIDRIAIESPHYLTVYFYPIDDKLKLYSEKFLIYTIPTTPEVLIDKLWDLGCSAKYESS